MRSEHPLGDCLNSRPHTFSAFRLFVRTTEFDCRESVLRDRRIRLFDKRPFSIPRDESHRLLARPVRVRATPRPQIGILIKEQACLLDQHRSGAKHREPRSYFQLCNDEAVSRAIVRKDLGFESCRTEPGNDFCIFIPARSEVI
jgi:hypothetical protein